MKTDLWSVGAILYETLTGFPPFPAKSQLELLQMLDKKITFPAHIKVSPGIFYSILNNLKNV